MRSWKNRREVKAYLVANKSQYGRITGKFFHQGELFEKDSDDVWYKKDDLATDEKLSMWRNAERGKIYNGTLNCMDIILHKIFFFSKGSLLQSPSLDQLGRNHQDGVL